MNEGTLRSVLLRGLLGEGFDRADRYFSLHRFSREALDGSGLGNLELEAEERKERCWS